MSRFGKDCVRGVVLALPVLALVTFALTAHLKLKRENEAIEAARLEAIAAQEAAENELARRRAGIVGGAIPKPFDPSAYGDMRDASPERLAYLVDFLKGEIAAAEAEVNKLKSQNGSEAKRDAERLVQLLEEIGRLNAEIERLREERDHWKKQAQGR